VPVVGLDRRRAAFVPIVFDGVQWRGPAQSSLSLLTFLSSVVPVIGTALVWLPATGWFFSQGSTGQGIFMIIWEWLLQTSTTPKQEGL